MPRFEKARRLVALVLAAVGWSTLAIQFYITIYAAMSNGKPVMSAILGLTSFFTILTNLLVAVCLTVSCLSKSEFSPSPSVMTAVALYIAIVGIVYAVLLRKLWEPQGLQLLTDVLLHDVMPVMFVLFWVFFVPKGTLQWSAPVFWLGYPLAYLVVTLARGASSGFYPYPFINIPVLGYQRAGWNAALLTIGFAVFGLFLVGLDGILGRFYGANLTRNDGS